jgi:ubiquitin-like 1-activating enzyme E1 A
MNTTDDARIRTANILLVSIKALANEIAKNLVLAGIGSITLADHEVVTEEDLGAQFFISDADVGKNVCRPCSGMATTR